MAHRTYEIWSGADRKGGPFYSFGDATNSNEGRAAPVGTVLRVSPMVEGEPCAYEKIGPGRWKKRRIARADPGDAGRLYGRLC